MTFAELLKKVNALLPEDLIHPDWVHESEPIRPEFFENAEPLAYFVVLELEATYDPDAGDADQLLTAANAMDRAAKWLLDVSRGLVHEAAKVDRPPAWEGSGDAPPSA